METKNCYHELPEGYELVKEIDAIGDKLFAILFNVAGLIMAVVAMGLVWLLRYSLFGGGGTASFVIPMDADPVLQRNAFSIALILGMIAYMILHELTHGIVYKYLTHEKLTFGLSLSCAYCGVPNVYVNRKTALAALIAPFIVFSVIFLLIVFLADGWLSTWALIQFGVHFGGCAGDLYDTLLLLTSLRGDLLMMDTGPKQSFYIRKS